MLKYKENNRNTPAFQIRKLKAGYTGNIRLPGHSSAQHPDFPAESTLLRFLAGLLAFIRQQATAQPALFSRCDA